MSEANLSAGSADYRAPLSAPVSAPVRPSSRAPLPRPATAQRMRINWAYAIGVSVIHALALLAFVPWLFSWTGVALVFIGNYIFCSLGIGAGYHRCLTHKSFKCSKRFEHFLAFLGVCSLQESPLRWVGAHRMHHRHADEQPDPHSPLVNFFWGHMGWLMTKNSQFGHVATYEKYVRDLLRDPYYRALERNGRWVYVYALHAVAFFVAGLLIGWVWGGTYMDGLQYGLSLLVWGVFVRTVYTWHVTWAVNSVAHMWGYRNYETGENSRNNWLIGLATNGEGWHNNHHHDQRSAAHGFHRWWELDVTYLSILAFERLGLVWDVTRSRSIGRAEPAPPA